MNQRKGQTLKLRPTNILRCDSYDRLYQPGLSVRRFCICEVLTNFRSRNLRQQHQVFFTARELFVERVFLDVWVKA